MKRRTYDLLEFTQPSRVDTLENGTVVLRGVKYLGARSANRNRDGSYNEYPLPVRRAAEARYDGAKIFANHPDRKTPAAERPIEAQLGRLRGPFDHREDGSYADLHLTPHHPLTARIAWSAEHSPDDLGLSHNAVGTGKVVGTAARMESIDRVRSVDVVCAGATTHGLFEGLHDEDDMKLLPRLIAIMEGADEAKLLEALDDEQTAKLVELLGDSSMAAEEKVMAALAMLAGAAMGAETEDPADGADGTEAPAVDAEESRKETPAASGAIQALEAKVAKLEREKADAERRARRSALLESSGLRPDQISDRFRADVLEAETDEVAKARIADRKRLAFHQAPTASRRFVTESASPDSGEIKTKEDLLSRLS